MENAWKMLEKCLKMLEKCLKNTLKMIENAWKMFKVKHKIATVADEINYTVMRLIKECRISWGSNKKVSFHPCRLFSTSWIFRSYHWSSYAECRDNSISMLKK